MHPEHSIVNVYGKNLLPRSLNIHDFALLILHFVTLKWSAATFLKRNAFSAWLVRQMSAQLDGADLEYTLHST